MNGRVQDIAGSVERILEQAQHAEREILEVASVAGESSASAEEVSASSQQTSASAQEIASTADELDRLVRRFRVGA